MSPETKVAIRVLLGLLCVAVTVIVTASLISYAFSWKADYSLKTDPQMWRETVQTQNICGKMGYLRDCVGDTTINLMYGIKKVFDPNLILNPGKVCYPVDV